MRLAFAVSRRFRAVVAHAVPATVLFLAALTAVVLSSCSTDILPTSLQSDIAATTKETSLSSKQGTGSTQALTFWRVGNANDVTRTTSGGTVLMGGGTDVDEAFRWMISKSGGGDFVILRATGTNAYNDYVYTQLGGVNSCETILIDSRAAANDATVEQKIRNAEAVFIAGGDQSNYVNFWEGTKVEDALNYLINTKKVPVGGTSAGCAIQGKIYFSAVNLGTSTLTSAECLANPYNTKLTLGRDNFLNNSALTNTITDTHFNNPDRRGRLVTFLARMSKDYGIMPKGIGVDEQTAVCIENGVGKVYGSGTAFFLIQNTSAGVPERCVSGSSLDWYRSKQAIEVYKVSGTTTGANSFNVSTWASGTGGSWQFYYVDRGTLGISY
jgi:cyanophycinase-like exopeptidase